MPLPEVFNNDVERKRQLSNLDPSMKRDANGQLNPVNPSPISTKRASLFFHLIWLVPLTKLEKQEHQLLQRH
jgi:hypothetical protein